MLWRGQVQAIGCIASFLVLGLAIMIGLDTNSPWPVVVALVLIVVVGVGYKILNIFKTAVTGKPIAVDTMIWDSRPTTARPSSPDGFCTNCGSPRSAGARFCTHCGGQHSSKAGN
jgi:xanthosine utilization system XapX-like protein